MVLAARLRRIPAALTEADAHLGLANRLAAPFARARVPRTAGRGRDGSKYRAVGRPVPARSRAVPRAEARERLGLPADGRRRARLRRLARRAAAQRARARRVGRGRARCAAPVRRARLRLAARARHRAPTTCSCRSSTTSGSRTAPPTSRVARAGGSVWELAAAGLPAVLVPGEFATGGHQRKNADWFARAGGAVVVPEADAHDRARSRRDAARRPRTARGDGRGDARGGETRRRGEDRR